MLGPTELLLIFGILILMFGAKRLPEMARGMGQAVNEWKSTKREIEEIGTDIQGETQSAFNQFNVHP